MMTTPRRGEARVESLFAALAPEGEATPARLLERLGREAERRGLLDVAYRTLATPVGTLLVAATPEGVVRVAYDCEGHDAVLAALAEQISPRILPAPARLDAAARQLDEYFAGRRRGFDLALDLRLARGFRRSVLAALRALDYGATATYASIAAAVGSPAAVRAVGTACAKNPLPVLVPCHRVLRSDGAVGQYVGGLGAKKALLALEAA
jgi:methylated-DNA-[protein]-cysteine S-methyltransferase